MSPVLSINLPRSDRLLLEVSSLLTRAGVSWGVGGLGGRKLQVTKSVVASQYTAEDVDGRRGL